MLTIERRTIISIVRKYNKIYVHIQSKFTPQRIMKTASYMISFNLSFNENYYPGRPMIAH